jgi:hypothetical protein
VLMIAARAGNTVLVQNVIKMSLCFFGKDDTRKLLDMQVRRPLANPCRTRLQDGNTSQLC